MGTSLSGLTPATTFDGLLKVGDNDPLTADLKAISTGDGTDKILSLSTGALQIGGETIVEGATTGEFFKVRNASNPSQFFKIEKQHESLNIFKIGTADTGLQFYDGTRLRFFVDDFSNAKAHLGSDGNFGIGETTPTSRLHVKSSGNTSADYALKILNSDDSTLFDIRNDSVIRIAPNSTNAVSFRNAKMQDGNAVFGTTTIPASTRMTIKGQGATEATASLLVQDSAGSELFKLTDDGNINLGEPGASPIIRSGKNSGKSLKLGNQAHLSAFDTIDFKTWDGTAYSEVMRITGNTNQFVGIGESTPTARLHVKGSGNDNTTTSLLVQNSDGTERLKITDDGEVNFRQVIYVNHETVSSRALRLGWGSIYGTDNNSELSIGAVLAQAATAPRITLGGKTRASGADAIQVQALNGMYIAPTASTENPSAQLHIKGSGATSATTALLVENSAGTDLLKVQDDGNVVTASVRAVGNLRLGASGTDRYYVTSAQIHPLSNQDLGRDNSTSYHWNNVYSTGVTHITDNTTSSTTLNASAKLQVDSTTQGFLPPRMTDAERDAIATPAAGLMIYDTSNNQMNYWNGSTWIAF